MTDKKLTDREIIKRLERCVKRGNRNYDTDIVLDLINRLQAENEKNENIIRLADKTIETANAEIERLKKGIAVDIEGYASEYDNRIKAKAYKELAEKLKEKIGDCHIVSDGEYCGFDCGDIHGCIDNLLKEMKGE